MLFHSSFGSSAASFQASPFKGFIIANGNTIHVKKEFLDVQIVSL